VRYPVYRLDSYQKPAVDPLTLPWQEKMRIMQTLTENPKALDPIYLKKTDCEWKHVPGINKTDIKAGRLMTAMKECKRLCKLNPYDTQSLYLLGKLYDWADRPDLSSETFNQLLKLIPNHPHARLIMAKQKINQGELEEAERLIKDDVRLFGSREETDFYHGKVCQQRKQYANAATYFENITKTMPEWVDVQIQLGDCLIEMGQLEDAARICDQAFNSVDNNKIDRDWLRSQAASGAARALAPLCPASKTLERYLLRDPQNIIIAHRQAHFLLDEGKTDEAKPLFETFSDRFKDYPENNTGKSLIESQLFHLGQIHRRAGQYTRAATCLERVVHSLPRWFDAQRELAETLVGLGNHQRALYHYEVSFEMADQQADKDWLRSQIALSIAKICINESPSSETLRKYSSLDPHNEILSYACASALENEGLSAEARLLFKKFTLSFKKDHLRANAWFRLARLSPTEQQKPLLAECIKLNPDHGGAQKLLRELDCKEQLV
jgi:tetratricopeptide (TPR) repeat protein